MGEEEKRTKKKGNENEGGEKTKFFYVKEGKETKVGRKEDEKEEDGGWSVCVLWRARRTEVSD